MSEELAKTEQRAPSTLASVASMLRNHKDEIEAQLPKHLTPERMMTVALGCLRRNPKLQQCDPRSLASAIVAAGRLGLEVDDQLGRAYLVPYGREASLIVGYKGLVDLAWRSGMVASVESQAVYKGDRFYYQLGLRPALKHVPGASKEPGDMTHVYAIVRLTTGVPVFEVMTRSQVEAIRSRSKSGQSGPWVTDYVAMARKTVVRQALRLVPMSVDRREDGAILARAIDIDEAFERGEPVPVVLEQIDPETGEVVE